ncbi:VCBS repeat-containing protein [Parasphingopyxis sp. CP4]|uniref:FG-GAP repeat domain-containing protein n=1 Tax=Parasphingopyxis sp. CP4 TaxID=2724527 RepID=UPI0015A0BA7F|nr:VCBS repeat-containing protein [Parasphingopyxis sp. CP4]QLC21493.1 VCBS repeat-containing protein [Parasphingopyxis sp. CP4]
MKNTFAILALTAALGLSATAATARDSHAQWVEIQSISQPIYQPGGSAHAPRNPGNFTGPGQTSQVGLLLPAVQSAREAARRNSQRAAPGGLPRGYTRQPSNRSPRLGQDGNDLLIVNNGDGSDFNTQPPSSSFRGGVRVATGDVNGDGQD